MHRFVLTVRKRLDAVIAYSDLWPTNAISEGVSRTAGTLKNRASGFRHLGALPT
ncbi:transposase [Granulosicoccus sp. 3-233]|uniref:transposase n=1 Tax=Granulosicoccus sp. 3-233 TaxID=3417969 RepID=UPI003D334B3C